MQGIGQLLWKLREKEGNLITGAKDVVLKELYINGNKVRK